MDTFFGLEHTHSQNEESELLTTVYDTTQLLMTQSILQEAGIPFLAKERGSGNSLKIIAGFSVFGTDLYVLPQHLSLARTLLSLDSEEEAAEEQENGGDSQ